MFYQALLSTLSVALFATQTFAAVPKEKPLAEYLAIATANSVNRYTSVEEFVTSLGAYRNKAEAAQLKAEMEKRGVVMKQKFPKMEVKGNKVYFAQDAAITYTDKSLSINGKTFTMSKKTLPEIYVMICNEIGCDKKTAKFSLISEAHAALSREMLSALGAIGGAALGYGISNYNCDNNKNYYQNNYNGYNQNKNHDCNQWVGAAIGAAVGGFGTYFLTNENKYACDYNCTVQCDGQYYTFQNNNGYNSGNYGNGNYANLRLFYSVPINYNNGGNYGNTGYGNYNPSNNQYYIPNNTTYNTSPGYSNNYLPPCNQAQPYILSDLQRDLNSRVGYPGNYNNGGNYNNNGNYPPPYNNGTRTYNSAPKDKKK